MRGLHLTRKEAVLATLVIEAPTQSSKPRYLKEPHHLLWLEREKQSTSPYLTPKKETQGKSQQQIWRTSNNEICPFFASKEAPFGLILSRCTRQSADDEARGLARKHALAYTLKVRSLGLLLVISNL